ncbi:unnamed protein product [Cylicostephanus goldi]|uniref:Uncharacterized protein n=1 Tax=Cylicostephanus goldi TaxID=71465 RepID=A0A3P6QL23_CYLGO|nr:unnamed protein product [Cylicostephanus goldi]
MAITGVLAAFSPSVVVFGAIRLVQGVFYTVRYYLSKIYTVVNVCLKGSALVGWVLGYECTPVKLRVFWSLMGRWILHRHTNSHVLTQLEMVNLLGFYSATHYCYLVFDVSHFKHFDNDILVPESLHFLALEKKERLIDHWLERAQGSKKTLIHIKAGTVVSSLEENPEAQNLFVELWAHKIFLVYTMVLIYLW